MTRCKGPLPHSPLMHHDASRCTMMHHDAPCLRGKTVAPYDAVRSACRREATASEAALEAHRAATRNEVSDMMMVCASDGDERFRGKEPSQRRVDLSGLIPKRAAIARGSTERRARVRSCVRRRVVVAESRHRPIAAESRWEPPPPSRWHDAPRAPHATRLHSTPARRCGAGAAEAPRSDGRGGQPRR